MSAREKRHTVLPIFPLPDVVFFPETDLPLHIFEPRYRELLSDALEGDRTIGIQLLDPAAPADAAGRPAVYAIGCAGKIVDYEPLDDGRSNILLKGVFRYRIGAEHQLDGRSYRMAEVEEIPILPLPREGPSTPSPRDMRRLLTQMVTRLALSVGRAEASILPDELSDEGLVNEAASRLGLDADDRYKLLAMDRLAERYTWVVSHIATIQSRLDLLAPYRKPNLEARWN
jgi:Lon protease-like protein